MRVRRGLKTSSICPLSRSPASTAHAAEHNANEHALFFGSVHHHRSEMPLRTRVLCNDVVDNVVGVSSARRSVLLP